VDRAHSSERIACELGIGASGVLFVTRKLSHGAMVEYPAGLESATDAPELGQRRIEKTQRVVGLTSG
jgi:hypothetical protein